MYRFLTLLIITIIVSACHPESHDARFRDFLTAHNYWRPVLWQGLQPSYGTRTFNDLISPPKSEVFSSNLTFCKNQLIAIDKINPDKLNNPLKHEYFKTRRFLEKTIHDLEVIKIHETNPDIYSLRPFFEYLLRKKNISNEQIIELLEQNLNSLPEYYQAVKTNLKSSSYEMLKIALEQEKVLYFSLDKKIPLLIKTLPEGQGKAVYDQLLSNAKIAIKDYLAFLNSLKFEADNQRTDSLTRLPNRYPLK